MRSEMGRKILYKEIEEEHNLIETPDSKAYYVSHASGVHGSQQCVHN